MPHRIHRLLLLWFFVALQAMAPFIHAHAGEVRLNHAGFFHLHQAASHDDVSCHVIAADDHGEEVAVAVGMPLRNAAAGVPAGAPLEAGVTLPCLDAGQSPGTDLPMSSAQRLPLADHTLPHALAPPAV